MPAGDRVERDGPRYPLATGPATLARWFAAAADELEELTGLRTGPSAKPDDPVLARLLPDFALDDAELSGALRITTEVEALRSGAPLVALEHLALGL